MMKPRLSLLLASLALAALAFAPALAQAPLPTLKSDVTVSGELVRVGDLIDNAGKAAETPVFRAPDIGMQGTVQVGRIIEAVRPLGLGDVETYGRTEVTVTRATRTVPLAELQERVAQRAADKLGLTAQQVIVNFDAGSQPMRTDPARKGEAMLADLNFDPLSGRFDATFDLPGSGRPLGHRLYGSAVEAMTIVVPTRAIARGEVVRASDLAIETQPRTAFGGIGRDALSTVQAVAGLAARRQLSPRRPVRPADLMKPELIEKNAIVTISYQVPGILVTLRGKAVDSGAEGDVITVTNLQSGKTIQAIVTGPNRVTLMTLKPPKAEETASVNQNRSE